MDFKKIIENCFQGKRTSSMKNIAIISGITVSAIIGALLTAKKGKDVKNYLNNQIHHLTRNQNIKIKEKKLGNLINDIRSYIKQSADGLLGPEGNINEVPKIQVNGIPTSTWKNPKEKSTYPKMPDQSIKIVQPSLKDYQ